MSRYEPGVRVFAVRNADSDTVYAYGYGTYVGDRPRPGWAPTEQDRAQAERYLRDADARPVDLAKLHRRAAALGKIPSGEAEERIVRDEEWRAAQQARPMAERVEELLHRAGLNPKIVLDGGAGVVWGYECWWAPADHPRWHSLLADRAVVTVPAPHPAEVDA